MKNIQTLPVSYRLGETLTIAGTNLAQITPKLIRPNQRETDLFEPKNECKDEKLFFQNQLPRVWFPAFPKFFERKKLWMLLRLINGTA